MNDAATTPLGAVLRDGDGYRLEFVRYFPDPVERVWAAITDSDELAGWFGTWTGDPSTGSILVHFRESPEPGPVFIQECDAPHRLALSMETPDGPWPLTIDLESTDEGTKLTFVHVLAEPYDATSVGPGWHYYADRLEAHVAGTEIPDNWDPYQVLGSKYGLPD